jgi:alginate O-acetyltransferase complex protein AlgJ
MFLNTNHWQLCARMASVLLGGAWASVSAQEASPGIVGQQGWLFYRHEFSNPSDDANVSKTIDLLRRVNAQLARNGTQLVVVMAPLKIRVHSEFLPPSAALTDHLKGSYGRMLQALRSGGVAPVDLETAFIASQKRNSPMPLYFKRDTHWSSAGALLAAETVRDMVQADTRLQQLTASLPKTRYQLTWSSKDWPVDGDLPPQLPKGSPQFDKELIKIFTVEKLADQSTGGLLDNSALPITLLGSSYTADWTNFPAAMRYALQSDLLSISVDALQGQWFGLHSYLRDDAFQAQRPKLLIWEMPARDMRAPPDFQWREARYKMNATEWLLQTSALLQIQCIPSGINAKVSHATVKGAQSGARGFSTPASVSSDYVELQFDKPLQRKDYLSGKLVVDGSKVLTLEVSSKAGRSRTSTLPVAGDDVAHVLRTALVGAEASDGISQVRFFPGTTRSFSLQEIQVCQQPADLLN